jgi:predicted SAM-dependent methyltransferase
MIQKLIRKLRHQAVRLVHSLQPLPTVKDPGGRLTQRQMISHLASIPYWEHKIESFKGYSYSIDDGVWLDETKLVGPKSAYGEVIPNSSEFTCINYGCGGNLIDHWLNVDLFEHEAQNYKRINLIEKHPFEGNAFQFGFCEDVLEHLNQAQSIFFLSEIHRTLKNKGVLRLSFPGLEGVLQRHYTPASEVVARVGEVEAYAFWDHIHFYSRDEISLVAKTIGFNEIRFVEYGQSEYAELKGRDTRSHQIGLNTYVELVK